MTRQNLAKMMRGDGGDPVGWTPPPSMLLERAEDRLPDDLALGYLAGLQSLHLTDDGPPELGKGPGRRFV